MSAGVSYNSISYDKQVFSGGTFINEEQSKSAIEPFGMAGAQVQYNLWNDLIIKVTADYCMLVEEKKQYSFMSYGLGAGWGF